MIQPVDVQPNSDVDLAIGARIKLARVERGLSLDEAASSLGLSVAELDDYEGGERRPSPDQILQIANLYKTKVSELFSLATRELD